MIKVFSFLLLFVPFQETGPNSPRIVAQINDEIITDYDLAQKLKRISKVSDTQWKAELRKLAEEKLLQQEAQKYKIDITEEDVNAALAQDIKRYGDEKKFMSNLRFLGMTRKERRSELKESLLIESLYRHIHWQGLRGGGTLVLTDNVSPEEIRELYEARREDFQSFFRITVERIALTWQSPVEKKAKHKLAESLLRRLQAGYDFYILAYFYTEIRHQVSDDPESTTSPRIPDLDRNNSLFTEKTNALLFEELPIEEVSPIIEEKNTLNIFRILNKQEQKELTFEEAQIPLHLQIRYEKRIKNRKRILEELIKHAHYWPEDLFSDTP